MPLGGVLLRLADQQWSGTLLIHDGRSEPCAALRLNEGQISAGRANGGTQSLLQSLAPLCARGDECAVLADGRDLLGDGPDVSTEPIDLLRLMAAAMRGPLRDDIVDRAIVDIGEDLLKLSPHAAIDRYGLTSNERRAVIWLDEPVAVAELRRSAGLPERVLRRVVYLLLATRGVTRMPPWRRVESGALLHAPTVPGPGTSARNDEPTRVASVAPTSTVMHWPAPMSLPPEAAHSKAGRYSVRPPEHHKLESRPPQPQTQARASVPAPARRAQDVDAETCFSAAELLLAHGNVRAAVFEAQKGMKLRSPRPKERALYAWLLYQRGGAGVEVHPHVWDHLEAALLADPSCVPAHYFKGVLLARTGRAAEAIFHLASALQLDPQHREAQRELRGLDATDRAAEVGGA